MAPFSLAPGPAKVQKGNAKGGALLYDLGLVFGLLAVGSLIAPRIRISPIPFFLVVGSLLGAQGLYPLGEEAGQVVQGAGELGALMLLFSLGLEFSAGRLLAGGRRFLWAGGLDLLITWPAGFLLGLVFWGPVAGFFVGTMLYISSSAIIVAFLVQSGRLVEEETEGALGILVFEDVAIGVLLVLAAMMGGGAQGAELALSLVIALLAAAGLGVLALWGGRMIEHGGRLLEGQELHLSLMAAVVLMGMAAAGLGLSGPLGALALGMAFSELSWRDRVEQAVRPLRDILGALFFVSVGAHITAGVIGEIWAIVALAVLVAAVAKMAVGFTAARPLGLRPRQGFILGSTLIPRGEFSLIVATLAAQSTLAAAAFTEYAAGLAGLLVLGTTVLGVPLAQAAPTLGRRRPAAGDTGEQDEGLSVEELGL